MDISYSYALGATLLEEFYVPTLEQATTYDRVAGYFSSAILSHAIAGFAKFCTSENPRAPIPKFRLIVGARLSAEDEALALHGGEVNSTEIEEILGASIVREVERFNPEDMDEFTYTRFQGFSWMLQEGIIEIKVGSLWEPASGRLSPHSEAEFHSKFGILSDGSDRIAFQGSANETSRGWLRNHESIDVYCSWEGGREETRISEKEVAFEQLWDQQMEAKGILVTSFPEAATKKILEQFPPRNPVEIDEFEFSRPPGNDDPHDVDDKQPILWPHQQNAIEWFFDPESANGVGIYQLATGSGKTWTAIETVKRSIAEHGVDKAIICVPKTLENQWEKVIKQQWPSCPKIYWWRSGQNELSQFVLGGRPSACLIVSHHYIPELLNWAEKHSKHIGQTILVIDELHHIGTGSYSVSVEEDDEDEKIGLEFSPNQFDLFVHRLGLSATPWNAYDSQRNLFIAKSFCASFFPLKPTSGPGEIIEWEHSMIEGGFVFYFGLEEAIQRGILCEFDYIPLAYTPSQDDRDKAREAFNKVDPRLPPGQRKIQGMINAALVYKTSEEKIPEFEGYLTEVGGKKWLTRALVFVGSVQYGRLVGEMLSNKFDVSHYREFFGGENLDELQKFAEGERDLLIACQRISEGLDIQSVERIVMFSAANSRRETIQRIGRALRISPENPTKRAVVIDFIRTSDDVEDKDNSDLRRKDWLTKVSKSRRQKT